MTKNKYKVDALIRDDHSRTTSELYATVGVENAAVMAIIRELAYKNICTDWVPKISTTEIKQP